MTAQLTQGVPRPTMIVTGTAGLIGIEIADVLTDRGVDVLGVDSAQPPPERARRWARSTQLDITDEAAVRRAVEEMAAQRVQIDALVHAAAITGRTPTLQPHSLLTVDLDLWRRVLDVNLTGALLCARAFGTLLRPAPAAQILFVGSIQGLVPTFGASAYAVSKAALVGLVRQLAAEYAAHGVRVNLVAPGPVAEASERARLAAQDAGEDPTPLGRFGSPREIAEAVADLVTGSFSLLTGAVVPLDGGEHLRPRTGPRRSHPPVDRSPPEAAKDSR